MRGAFITFKEILVKTKTIMVAALLGLSLGMTACDKKEGPMEKMSDNVKDGLDARPNEGIKDAGENVKDAAKDAKEEVKDAVN
jgi:hypothetical protein